MDWTVRFVDYPEQFRKLEPQIMQTVKSIFTNGDLMLRHQLRDFEQNLATFVGTKFAVGTSNCTDALHLSLRAAGIGPGHEVITVSHTFVATAEAIRHAGATPLLIDIGADHNMDVELVEEAVTPKTKAIIPVHLNGRLCDMDNLLKIADKHGLVIIEDSAQALGASLNKKCGGSVGIAGCFSFYPAKLLGAFGDAGAVTTNDKSLAEKVTLLRDHGRTPDGDISGWAFNCRLDNLQAALLDLKLPYLPSWIDRRRDIAIVYHQRLCSLGQLRLPPAPMKMGPYFDVFQNYEVEAEERDRLVAHLKQKGIEIMVPWGGKAIHQFRALGLTHFDLPRTEQLFQNVLLLPIHTELTNEQVEYVCQTIQDFYKG